MGRGLVGDDVDRKATPGHLGEDLRGVAKHADRNRPPCLFGLEGELQRVVEVGSAHVQVPMLEAALDSLGIHLDANRDAAI